ncbi:MAG: hypothetical protein ACE5HV_08105 [Acidobacteriota bacterium]
MNVAPVRAVVLMPMNSLVAGQLVRQRLSMPILLFAAAGDFLRGMRLDDDIVDSVLVTQPRARKDTHNLIEYVRASGF